MNRKQSFNIILFAILLITLSSCEKDCNGNYTIEGLITTGTKGKPRTAILVNVSTDKGMC